VFLLILSFEAKAGDKAMKQEAMSLKEWQERFPDEESCRAHIAKVRWPEGFICPHCGGKAYWYTGGYNLYHCKNCNKRTSAMAGTIFHSTKIPLKDWFTAIYLVTVDKGGVSATRLQTYLQISWNSANAMLMKLRIAMGARDQEYLLKGLIELDDAFIGGKTTGGKRGRGSEKKTAILVGCEHDAKNKRAGFLKMKVVEKMDAKSVEAFSNEALEPSQDLRTDGSPTLKTLEGKHRVESQVIPPQETSKWLPWVHIAIANLKRFLLGTYHGVSGFHLQKYLDEFCYRFNRRWCTLEIPNRLLHACLIHKPTLCSAL
jgi:transposase-like protein